MMARDRGSLWTDGEVTAPIAIWGEEDIQWQLDGAIRNISVYEKIATRLTAQEHCSERTAVQCREKIKKIKSDYKRAKDNTNRLGRGRIICAFYSQLDAILGCRPSSTPSSVIETCLPQRTVFVLELGPVKRLGWHWILLHLVELWKRRKRMMMTLVPVFKVCVMIFQMLPTMRCCTTPKMRAWV